MSLTLYLLRHGQTAASRDRIFSGAGLEPELTADGEAMAQAFAEAYRSLSWAAVYSSPQKRALATAAPLCQAAGLSPLVRDGLREIGYGNWEGRSAAEVEREFHDDYVRWQADPAWNAPSGGGESALEIAQRALAVVEEIRQRFAASNVLVVSHKATIRIVVCALLGIDLGRYRQRLDCPVASLSVIEFTSHGPFLRTLADRSHLPERLRDLTES